MYMYVVEMIVLLHLGNHRFLSSAQSIEWSGHACALDILILFSSVISSRTCTMRPTHLILCLHNLILNYTGLNS